MACTSRVLGMSLPHHWQRSFVGTDTGEHREMDMWGRGIATEHVVCHTRLVCSRCGAIGESVECICDKTKADRCAFRLNGMSGLEGV